MAEEDIKLLNLSGIKEFNQENLVQFPNLEELDVSDTDFDKVEILGMLPKLSRVNLANTPIKDLSSLSPRILSGHLKIAGKELEVGVVHGLEKKRFSIDNRVKIEIPKEKFLYYLQSVV